MVSLLELVIYNLTDLHFYQHFKNIIEKEIQRFLPCNINIVCSTGEQP